MVCGPGESGGRIELHPVDEHRSTCIAERAVPGRLGAEAAIY